MRGLYPASTSTLSYVDSNDILRFKNIVTKQEELINQLLKDCKDNLQRMVEALGTRLDHIDAKLAEIDLQNQNGHRLANYDGKIILRIQDFQQQLHNARRGRVRWIYSHPFYTSKCGYKMCLKIYLNGNGKGMRQISDKPRISELQCVEPFYGIVTLMLIDPNQPDAGTNRQHLSYVVQPNSTSSSFKKPISDKNIGNGDHEFVAHKALGPYVKDDSIFIGAIVDTTGLENF
uniref:TNF receptor-associated factor 2-like n=1 Tax=Styela clava TaxID=7725 RepID=UPI00193980BC|nr:TNF receptor-associated factor 2-like [Styela clava]